MVTFHSRQIIAIWYVVAQWPIKCVQPTCPKTTILSNEPQMSTFQFKSPAICFRRVNTAHSRNTPCGTTLKIHGMIKVVDKVRPCRTKIF